MPKTPFHEPQSPIINDTYVSPPGSESIGDRYIIAGTGGAWSGFNVGDIVEVIDVSPTVWDRYQPEEGDEVYVKTVDKQKSYDGSIWSTQGAGASNLEDLGDIGSASPTAGNILLANGTLFNAVSHKGLDELVHNIAEGSYYELSYNGTHTWRVDKETWYTDSGKVTKIREVTYTYDVTNVWKYTQIKVEQYNDVPAVAQILTGTVVYSGVFITDITWALT